jgi:hypothetical protein
LPTAKGIGERGVAANQRTAKYYPTNQAHITGISIPIYIIPYSHFSLDRKAQCALRLQNNTSLNVTTRAREILITDLIGFEYLCRIRIKPDV